MKNHNFIFLLISLLNFTSESVNAANHYVRSSATGNGSGSNWTNACIDFEGSCAVSSLVRGDTYYVAAGSYKSIVFNTPLSGTLTITIKGATSSDHGTDSGWSPSFGVDTTQAHWLWGSTYSVSISTSYFIFDGNTGSGSSPSAYGFIIDPPPNPLTVQSPALFVGILSPTTTTRDVTVRHVAYVGTDATKYDITANTFQVCGNPGYCSNITIANNYSEKTVKFLQSSSMANSTIENNYVKNVGANFGAHSEIISSNNCHSDDGGLCAGHTTQCVRGDCASNNTVRNNFFGGILGSSITGGIVALDGNPMGLRGWEIYGNIFLNCNGGNGCIATGTSGGVAVGPNTLIYNNTFVGSSGTPLFHQCSSPAPCAAISAGGNKFLNNLIYNNYPGMITGASQGGPTLTSDYNSYLSTLNGTPPTEAHGQIGNFDPFENSASSDFRLLDGARTIPGLNLGSKFSVDLDGKTRGSDGKWDVGAFEFSNRLPRPSAPKNLRIR